MAGNQYHEHSCSAIKWLLIFKAAPSSLSAGYSLLAASPKLGVKRDSDRVNGMVITEAGLQSTRCRVMIYTPNLVLNLDGTRSASSKEFTVLQWCL